MNDSQKILEFIGGAGDLDTIQIQALYITETYLMPYI